MTKALLKQLCLCLGILLVIATASHASDSLMIEHLMRTHDLDTAWYEVEVKSNGLRKEVLSGQEISFQSLSRKEPLGLFTVRVEVRNDDGVIQTGQVRFMIHRYANVLVASDKIARHQLLTGSHAVIERREVTNLTERPLVSLEELASCRAHRNLRSGTILTTGSIELCPDIEAGREVSVVYSDGLCNITAAGVAMQTGMAGDYIRVKNRSSGKIIMARIVDESAVAIDP